MFGDVAGSTQSAPTGVSQPGMIESTLDWAEVHRRQTQLNYLGTVYTTLAALPSLRKSKGAAVLVDSECALFSFAGYGAYAPSKFATRAFADALRNELVGQVRVAVYHPGSIDSPG